MAIHGNACIFRCTLAGDTESTVGNNPITGLPDKVEFDGSAVIPDSNGHLTETEAHGVVGFSENPKPLINNPNDLQDLGLSSVEYTFTGVVENAYAGPTSATFLAWLKDFRKTLGVTSPFPKGRFGIRYDNSPEWDTTPVQTGGWMLVDYYERKPSQFRTKLEFIAKFRYTGDPLLIGEG